MSRTIRVVALVAALYLAAGMQSATAQRPGGKPGGGPPPAPVVVAHIEEVREAPRAEYTGLIDPATKALLSSEVAGRLVRLVKRQGDLVKRNEVMAVLDNPAMEDDYAVRSAQLQETEAQARLAEKQQERQEQLFNNKLISVQQVEDGRLNLSVTRARLKAARVQVQRLKEQLDRMVIRSPIAGQVITATLELGQWITPNQPLFEIFNFDEYEVLVGVPGRLLNRVPGRGNVQVEVPEIGAEFEGEILAAVRHVNQQTGNFSLRVRVANHEHLPLSGMLAKVRLPVGEARRMLTVPRDAVVRRGERTHIVLVSAEGTAQIVPVKVQGNYGGAVIISGKGLDAGAAVVVRGNERLFPGAPVRIAGDQSSESSG